MKSITLECDGKSIYLIEENTTLVLTTSEPEEAQGIYNEIAMEIRRKVAGIL